MRSDLIWYNFHNYLHRDCAEEKLKLDRELRAKFYYNELRQRFTLAVINLLIVTPDGASAKRPIRKQKFVRAEYFKIYGEESREGA